MAEIYSFEELRAEKNVINQTFEQFTEEINSRLLTNNGMITKGQLEASIQIAMSSVKTSIQQRKVVDAFYDTYVGCWVIAGREMADSMAFSILSDLTEGIEPRYTIYPMGTLRWGL